MFVLEAFSLPGVGFAAEWNECARVCCELYIEWLSLCLFLPVRLL